jgi:hypothetical protein
MGVARRASTLANLLGWRASDAQALDGRVRPASKMGRVREPPSSIFLPDAIGPPPVAPPSLTSGAAGSAPGAGRLDLLELVEQGGDGVVLGLEVILDLLGLMEGCLGVLVRHLGPLVRRP